MSTGTGGLGGALRGQARRRVVGAVIVGLAALALGTSLAVHGSGSAGGKQLTANGQNGGTGSQGGSGGGVPQGQFGKVPGAPTPTNTGSGAGGGGVSGSKSGASARPGATPYPTPTYGDAVQGIPDVKTSGCIGYPPGVTCQIYYHGSYYLVSHAVGKVVIEALINGKVVASATYTAPGGGHSFGTTLKFQVPSGTTEVDYQSFLQDANGASLATSFLYKTYAG